MSINKDKLLHSNINTEDELDFDYNRDKNKKVEFDPIKVPKDGKLAEAIIWSTNVLERAVDGINKGLPLKANPFIGKNTQLLKPDLVYQRTPEEVADYIKCMNEPLYFASKCFIKTPTGMKACVLRDYQKHYIMHLVNNRFSLLRSCRQAGKCLILNTLGSFILTKGLNKKLDKKITKLQSIYTYITIDTNQYIFNDLPFYELQNLFDDSFIWKIKYRLYKKNKLSLISILDNIEYKYIYKEKLLDNYKTVKDIDISKYGIKILTDNGYQQTSHIYNTKPFKIYHIKTESNKELECADEHVLYNTNMNGVYVIDLKVGDYIQTVNGVEKITNIIYKKNKAVSMFDITVDHPNHRFYSNGILSHNSVTTAIFCLWTILFHTDKMALLLSKSGPAGIDLLSKIKDMYRYLPYYLKPGVLKWNQTEIAFDNNSSMSTESFSPTAGLGKTINFLVLDEFAWCPANEVELFYNNIIPTVTTDTSANVCIISTQNGFNLFYKLFTAAEKGENIYAPMTVNWWDVPNWDSENKCWVKRDEKWRKQMIGVLGSEEKFEYQYGTMFLTSDNCIVPRETLSRLMSSAKMFVTLNNHEYYKEHELYQSLYNKYFYIKDGYIIDKNKYYMIIVDLAEGCGKDYTVFNIIEIIEDGKFEQVARWTSNQVDLEAASLEFWLLYVQIFGIEHCIISIEWNTYGALFYTYIQRLNEPDENGENNNNWRFAYSQDGIESYNIVRYTKQSQEDVIAGIGKNSKTIPGVRMTRSSKKTACAMLKTMINKEEIIITDLTTISEIQNFEDTKQSGSYKASYGHDDIVMTLVQIPLIKNTTKYKNFMEDIHDNEIKGDLNAIRQNQPMYPLPNMQSVF